jgi:hypothetical protein
VVNQKKERMLIVGKVENNMEEYKYHSFNGLMQNRQPKPIPKAIIEPVAIENKKVDTLQPVNQFQCKKCIFIGKNDKSLRLHFIKKHANKNNL